MGNSRPAAWCSRQLGLEMKMQELYLRGQYLATADKTKEAAAILPGTSLVMLNHDGVSTKTLL